MKFFLPTVALAALTLGHNTAQAQSQKERPPFSKDHFSFFIAAGAQNYLGDLLPRNYGAFGAVYDLAPSVKLGAEYEITPYLRARLNYFGAKLYGSDASNYQNFADAAEASQRNARQISMTCGVNELSLNALFDVFGLIQAKREKWRFNITPYVGVGIGYAFVSPKLGDSTLPRRYAQTNGEMMYFERDFRKSPISGTLVFPITLGALWKINHKHAAFAEVSRHYTTTDYLDGISNWNSNAASNDGYINYAIGYRFTLADRY